jgi:tetratricopeptide (TPR) repeat protein
MRIKKEIAAGIIIILLLCSAFGTFIVVQKNKSRDALVQRIFSTNAGNGPPQTIEGLRSAIAAYESRIEQYVRDAAQTGIYWKILATRLQDKGLHNEALDALERAIYYTPEDSSLHYAVGISAGIVAKASLDFSGSGEYTERERYYNLAESAYLRAIDLDGSYGRPYYGIAVLYVFELNRPTEALPYLFRYMEISRNDVDAMFILARAYYMMESYQNAVEVYDDIIALTKDEKKRLEAQNNRQLLLDMLYG